MPTYAPSASAPIVLAVESTWLWPEKKNQRTVRGIVVQVAKVEGRPDVFRLQCLSGEGEAFRCYVGDGEWQVDLSLGVLEVQSVQHGRFTLGERPAWAAGEVSIGRGGLTVRRELSWGEAGRVSADIDLLEIDEVERFYLCDMDPSCETSIGYVCPDKTFSMKLNSRADMEAFLPTGAPILLLKTTGLELVDGCHRIARGRELHMRKMPVLLAVAPGVDPATHLG